MANRAQRRKIMKAYRHTGMTKEQAKAVVNTYYMGDTFKEGQKCKLNYEGIIRHPDFNNQKDEFKDWIHAHKDTILTVSAVRDSGMQVQFEEDENEEKFWHHTLTLFPIASAKIKMEDGTEKVVVLEDMENINDKINEAMNSDDGVVSVNTPIATEISEEEVKE